MNTPLEKFSAESTAMRFISARKLAIIDGNLDTALDAYYGAVAKGIDASPDVVAAWVSLRTSAAFAANCAALYDAVIVDRVRAAARASASVSA